MDKEFQAFTWTDNKVGLEEHKNYNIGYGEGKMSTCLPDKEDGIMDAFMYFNLI